VRGTVNEALRPPREARSRRTA